MDLNQMLFSPFQRRHCDYFYWLMVLNFVVLVGAVLVRVAPIKLPVTYRAVLMALLGPSLFGYFNSRMFYSMCLR